MVLLELCRGVDGLADAGAVVVAETDREVAPGDYVVYLDGEDARVSRWDGRGDDHHGVVVEVIN